MTTVLHGAQCVVVRYCRGRPGRPRTSRDPDVTTCGRLWADVPCVDRRNVEEGMRLREAHEEIVAVARGYTQVLSSAVVEGEGLTQLLCSTSPKDGGRERTGASGHLAVCVACLSDWACMCQPLAQTLAQL